LGKENNFNDIIYKENILKEAAGVRDVGGLVFDDMVSWYGTGWEIYLMFFGILIVGYEPLYWWHRRNS